MAGAASAGAYTAGVLDFLLEALAAFEAEKTGRCMPLPAHDVKLRVVSGTSAGGINAALLAIAVEGSLAPVRHADQHGAADNPFFRAWADEIDIMRMLGTRDLKSSQAAALFDSSHLDHMADAVFALPRSGKRPNYLADTFDLFITFTNLIGVPYDIELIGSQIRQHQPAGYEMVAHADYARFGVGLALKSDAHSLNDKRRELPPWQLLRDAALASSAFPGAFAPRRLTRPASDYAARAWPVPEPSANGEALRVIPPSWPLTGDDPVTLLCADGGVLNNEPIEMARRVLDHESNSDGHALILIDPFPRIGRFDPHTQLPEGLPGLALRLISALRSQASFKPEELVQALEGRSLTRFLIAPRRTAADGTLLAYPLAGGAFEGFSGFLERRFRVHDFLLGRRNAQRFLARHFALPSTHPAVSGWSEEMDRAFGIWPKGVAQTFPAPLRPIVPLTGTAKEPCPTPVWPAIEPRQLARLEALAKHRVSAVLKSLAAENLGTSLTARLATALIGAQQGRLTRRATSHIRNVLQARDQISSRARPIIEDPKHLEPNNHAQGAKRVRLKLSSKIHVEPEHIRTIGWGASIDKVNAEHVAEHSDPQPPLKA